MARVGSRMAATLQRVLHSASQQTVGVTRTLFTRYLLVTNTTVSVGLAGLGDLMNQRYEIFRGIQKSQNYLRSRNQCVQGLLLGPVYHFWYILLDSKIPGRAPIAVLKKVLVDQAVMSPISVLLFLVIVGSLEGQRVRQLKQDVVQKGPSLLAVEWTFGPMTQLVNFYFLPIRFRVVYDCVVSLCFDAYYAHVKYRKTFSPSPPHPHLPHRETPLQPLPNTSE